MEKRALSIIKTQVDRLKDDPEVQERIEAHIAETEGQIDRLDNLLDAVDEKPSAIKDAFLSVMGDGGAFSHAAAGDEVLKNSFANFAFENCEIAAYKALMVPARQSNHTSELPLSAISRKSRRWRHGSTPTCRK